MNASNAAKPFLRALAGQRVDTPPFWLMRQAGRYLPEYRELRSQAGSFLDLCYTPDFAAEVTLQPIRRFCMDAAILFADILLIPDALGQDITFKEGRGPVLDPLTGREDVARLKVEGAEDRLQPVYETVSRVAAALPPEVALIGFAGAPWTVATYMIEGGTSRDHALARHWAMAQPELLDELMVRLVDATTAYLLAQVAAGAEAIQLFESWAGALPDGLVERFSIRPIAVIVERLRAVHPDLPVMVFPRGAGASYLAYADIPGIAALSLDQSVPVEWAARELPRHLTLQGQMDPQWLVTGGDGMAREIARIIRAFSGRPHIFNLGHGVVPQTPPEHVAQLAAAVRGRSG